MPSPPPKTVKYSSDGRARYRNRSGVVEFVERDRLLFASLENGMTKFSPTAPPPQFWPDVFQILEHKQQFPPPEFSFLAAEEPTFGVGGYNFKTG